jgi:hypothetical protein
VNHVVEIWEMVREDRTVCVPTCLVCGWMGTRGRRPGAEREGLAHEEGGLHLWHIATRPFSVP